MAMILYKTGDPCPCCGQSIKLKNAADLYALSAIAHLRRDHRCRAVRTGKDG